jgi:hypothetical protein
VYIDGDRSIDRRRCGIPAKFSIHLLRGVRLNNLFNIHFVSEPREADTVVVSIVGATIFSNFMSLKTTGLLHSGNISIEQCLSDRP